MIEENWSDTDLLSHVVDFILKHKFLCDYPNVKFLSSSLWERIPHDVRLLISILLSIDTEFKSITEILQMIKRQFRSNTVLATEISKAVGLKNTNESDIFSSSILSEARSKCEILLLSVATLSGKIKQRRTQFIPVPETNSSELCILINYSSELHINGFLLFAVSTH